MESSTANIILNNFSRNPEISARTFRHGVSYGIAGSCCKHNLCSSQMFRFARFVAREELVCCKIWEGVHSGCLRASA
ncbi:hypothetical protein F0562_000704 [Nyssa sinensis]|uniref:Uncharacterized protein n=1 Tax=Nyssa sinensis TaxID=561372 RepID=A0A5J5C4I0_9ASTE|nr:hypothetical protein F0562_000704 [Nyssa sinensis]